MELQEPILMECSKRTDLFVSSCSSSTLIPADFRFDWCSWFRPEDGRTMKSICLLQLCCLGVIVYDWLDIAWLKNYYNFGFDHFAMGWRRTGILGLADILLGNSGPFASGDWILPDLTIQGSLKLNSNLHTFPNTFYFSYATRRTRRFMGVTVPSSVLGVHPLLFIRVLQMSQWRYPSNLPLPYKGYKWVVNIADRSSWKPMMRMNTNDAMVFWICDRDEEWEDNDGALNTISMTHPRIPTEHPSRLVVEDSECHPMQPGIWFVHLKLIASITFTVLCLTRYHISHLA